MHEADLLLVNGGDPLYLSYWMRESGLAELFPSLHEIVYVGLSAGSMVMAPNIGEDSVCWRPLTGGDETPAPCCDERSHSQDRTVTCDVGD